MIVFPCSGCGRLHTLEDLQAHLDDREALVLMNQLPGELSGLVIPYLTLFRTQKSHSLSAGKTKRLLADLKGLVDSEYVTHKHGAPRRCHPRIWREAIRDLVDSPEQTGKVRPLKSHAYLQAIAYNKADQADASREQQQEGRREPTGRESSPPKRHPDAPKGAPDDWRPDTNYAKPGQLSELLKNIGQPQIVCTVAASCRRGSRCQIKETRGGPECERFLSREEGLDRSESATPCPLMGECGIAEKKCETSREGCGAFVRREQA
ncbi:MAG: hypothetical protein HQL52_03830 [Magnetococcales bacterium]|nr:hypothetical protein [Magnetococcales bacterium]